MSWWFSLETVPDRRGEKMRAPAAIRCVHPLARSVALIAGFYCALAVLPSLVVAQQPVTCCESYYYCYDLPSQELPACEAGQTQGFAGPRSCNLWTRQCDVPTLSAESCLGDCDKDGEVDVSELIRAVNFALGSPKGICAGFGSPDGHVGIDGIIRAVNHALDGCPHQTAQCGGNPSHTNASLCGPPDRPCVILADNTLPGAWGDLAVDPNGRPHVLLRAEDGTISYGELAAEGGWQITQTGFSGSPVWLDVTDTPLALVNSATSDSRIDLWRRTGDVWQHVDTAPGVSTGSSSVQRDTGGCIHALTTTVDPPTGSAVLAYAVHTDDWSYLGYVNRPGAIGFGALGLDGLGGPMIAYWQPAELDHRNRTLLWRRPSDAAESVASAQSTFIVDDTVRVAFSGTGEGQPHILATRTFPGLGDQFGTELIYATRSAPGVTSSPLSPPLTEAASAWSLQVVVQGSADEFNPWRCEAPPGPGSVCSFSYDYVRALGLVASRSGDTRLFYVRQHVEGRVVGDCAFGSCTGRYDASSDGTLYVAWPENGSLSHAVVLEHIPYDRGTTVLDSRGRIHLLATGYQASRYLMLGTAS
jgi:hypothetical protein